MSSKPIYYNQAQITELFQQELALAAAKIDAVKAESEARIAAIKAESEWKIEKSREESRSGNDMDEGVGESEYEKMLLLMQRSKLFNLKAKGEPVKQKLKRASK